MKSIINMVAATLFFAPFILAADQPQAVIWSGKSYGPDGPWAAVTLEIGTPPQAVDLLPGGSWMTNVLEKGICNNTAECSAEDAGLYDYLASDTWVRKAGTGQIEGISMKNIVGADHSVERGSARWTFDTVRFQAEDGGAGYTVPIMLENFDMLVISKAEQSLPDGSKYPLTIGKLALGAPAKNQSWNDAPNPQWNGTLITSATYQQKRTQSNSYSLHVGSPSMQLPGSLVLGGYHKERALGPVSYQPYAIDSLPIDLLDISIGVAEGAPPFNFTSKSGLLAEGDSSFEAGLQVTVDATQPYLYLPPTTCAALASHLPVKFQPKYGVYFWNTKDPQYEKIITSPSYLGFTFRESTSVSTNITIKVPFSLLNLTLTAPLIQTPTPYFPCFGGQDPTEKWSLGRAFMQAALIGVKWEDKTKQTPGLWFLAQAPGPSTPKTIAPTSITPEDTEIEGSDTKWEDTWKGVWNVLEVVDDGTTKSTSSTSGTKGTSTEEEPIPAEESTPVAAIAGGTAGGAVLILLIIVFFLVYRGRKGKQLAAAKSPTTTETGSMPFQHTPTAAAMPIYGGYDEKSHRHNRSEMDAAKPLAEFPERSYHGRFGHQGNIEWRGNGYAQHGQGLGIGPEPPLGSERAPAEMYSSPPEMHAPWSRYSQHQNR